MSILPNLRARLKGHNGGAVASTRRRRPVELILLGTLPESDGCHYPREVIEERIGKALHQKTAATLSHWVKDVSTTMIYTHVRNTLGLGIRSPLDLPPGPE